MGLDATNPAFGVSDKARVDSNQSPQLQRLARKLKFTCSIFRYKLQCISKNIKKTLISLLYSSTSKACVNPVCIFKKELVYYPHAFLKKRRGYCNRLRPSVRPSVTLSTPKPLDEIQPNLVCGLLT